MKKKEELEIKEKEKLAGEIYDLNKKNGYKNPFSRSKAIKIMINGSDTAKGFSKSELKEMRDTLIKQHASKKAETPASNVTKRDLDKALKNFCEVKEIIKFGEARNLAFKKPMKFYREHSVEEAVELLKKQAKKK